VASCRDVRVIFSTTILNGFETCPENNMKPKSAHRHFDSSPFLDKADPLLLFIKTVNVNKTHQLIPRTDVESDSA
jgi:hypothetical protein